MKWKRVEFDDADMTTGKFEKLQMAFTNIMLESGAPAGVAMYGYKDSQKPNHFFFTPDAVRIADPILEEFGAIECDEPDISNLSVVSRSPVRRT